MNKRTLLLCGLLLLIPALVAAQGGTIPGELDPDAGIIEQFKQLKAIWFFQIFPAAEDLFWWLARVEFVLSFVLLLSAQVGMTSLTATLFKKALYIGFVYAMIL